jgi:hypothetical protein
VRAASSPTAVAAEVSGPQGERERQLTARRLCWRLSPNWGRAALRTRPEPPPRNALGQEFGPPDFWSKLGIRIALAGGLFPVAVSVFWFSFGLLIDLARRLVVWDVLHPSEVGAFLFGVVVSQPFLFGIGFAWAGAVGIVALPLLSVVIHLLGWPRQRDVIGVVAGSVVAYLATLPAALIAAYTAADTFDFLPALFVFAHCGLAIAMGQAAGCLAAVADLRRRRRGRLKSSGLRFGVWQLLALTVPVAVVLSVLKALDLLNPPMALASIAAAFCAVATWRPVTWLVNRWLDRRLAKRRRRRRGKESTWYR